MIDQPPSGGCELKPEHADVIREMGNQPPSGGCELKPLIIINHINMLCQPPSGGCELKPAQAICFGVPVSQPPSGGCELKHHQLGTKKMPARPAAFGRLRVETASDDNLELWAKTSRLRAAAS